MTVLVVTGTDTGVGKTVTTAALAAAARLAGIDVAVCKPVQTGAGASAATGESSGASEATGESSGASAATGESSGASAATGKSSADGDDDLGEVRRLSGVDALHGGWRYPEALAPVAAAARAGLPLPSRDELVAAIRAVDAPGRLTVVEGAGGLLVEIGADGVTLRDIAAALSAPVLVVVSPGLGTLNHTALTLESLAGQHIQPAGLVIGAWPDRPGVAEQGNREALAALADVRAVLPAGASALTPEEFQELSVRAFDKSWIASLV
ncbi:ATP-dependent dethiobiotin synthetase BioD [Mycolicibacterium sp. P9-22]|uniref:ATP-dependent dethiobiotin synthetase BioD n=1 Tax=Mycolicibacterium sp. P9-22 TaxID=2024613 RepID=UPI0011EDBD47|nr:ATP-dependent dethiobiotin synthetase BioD [Mycolicibacterium sp. P9-22]KAA0115711.1 dethiobiotin synthase [Mycolicibacterium sp. P9-22]